MFQGQREGKCVSRSERGYVCLKVREECARRHSLDLKILRKCVDGEGGGYFLLGNGLLVQQFVGGGRHRQPTILINWKPLSSPNDWMTGTFDLEAAVCMRAPRIRECKMEL
uniref:Uncharacterized protein n=1 Tax=Timema douglasi TaxID=61478 RepID=A0A7R8ZH59_TIMDO|nr:unnamed protein product [Timema douglasi]